MKAGRLLWRGALLTTTMIAAIAPGMASADETANGGGLTGQVIVRYEPDTTSDERSDAREEAEVELAGPMLLPRTQLLDPEPGQTVTDAVASLRSDPNVRFAEPDRLVPLNAAPDDGLLPQQWGLINAGQAIGSVSGTPGADLDAKPAWDIGRSSANTLTAVIDSGITTDHPDLRNQVWTNPGEVAGNGVDDDNNGFVDDVHGWDFIDGDNDVTDGSRHGSHVAGIIGATGNNGFGVTGVSWDANLMAVRACGTVGGCSLSAVVNGIAYATRMGARVVNMSLGGPDFSPVQRDAMAAATNTLFVVSAGNEGNDGPGLGDNEITPKYPCQSDQRPGYPALGNLICVASSDQFDARSPFSNWGATSVDLAAPGSNILSTVPAFTEPFDDGFDPGNDFWDERRLDLGETATAAGWERVVGQGAGGTGDRGLTDSNATNYAPNSNATVTMTGSGVSLAGREACGLHYDINLNTERPNPNSFTGADVLYVEASANAGGPWTVIDRQAGNSGGYVSSSSRNSQATLDVFAGDPSVYVRFRLEADADGAVGTGVSIDNVTVRCATPSPEVGHFNYLQGTSMSSPMVAGIASVVRELNPGLSAAEVKGKVLGGVDPVAAFSVTGPTPVVTGGRANFRKTLASLDLTPPPVPLLDGPQGTIGEPRPAFAWSVGQADARYELLIDEVPVAAGAGLNSYVPPGDLAEGAHTWRVTAADHPGNVSVSETREFSYARPGVIKVLSVKPLKRRKGGAKVRVRVSGAGRVQAIAEWRPGKFRNPVAKGSKKANGPGVTTLTLKPTRPGKRILRGRTRLKVKVKATFRPSSGGAPATARRAGKLAAPKLKRRR